MKCPFCNAEELKVIDSRAAEMNSIRRRRQCEQCGKRFTTYENIETITLLVVKRDQSREPYNREKLQAGILNSCRKRPVSVEQISGLLDEVENTLYNLGKREVSSKDIGELVMNKLKDIDDVAYVRFASVYQDFQDVHTFMEALQKLLNS